MGCIRGTRDKDLKLPRILITDGSSTYCPRMMSQLSPTEKPHGGIETCQRPSDGWACTGSKGSNTSARHPTSLFPWLGALPAAHHPPWNGFRRPWRFCTMIQTSRLMCCFTFFIFSRPAMCSDDWCGMECHYGRGEATARISPMQAPRDRKTFGDCGVWRGHEVDWQSLGYISSVWNPCSALAVSRLSSRSSLASA